MLAAFFFAVIVLSVFDNVQAQDQDCTSVTITAVASVCATFGFFFILLLIYLLWKKYCKSKYNFLSIGRRLIGN